MSENRNTSVIVVSIIAVATVATIAYLVWRSPRSEVVERRTTTNGKTKGHLKKTEEQVTEKPDRSLETATLETYQRLNETVARPPDAVPGSSEIVTETICKNVPPAAEIHFGGTRRNVSLSAAMKPNEFGMNIDLSHLLGSCLLRTERRHSVRSSEALIAAIRKNITPVSQAEVRHAARSSESLMEAIRKNITPADTRSAVQSSEILMKAIRENITPVEDAKSQMGTQSLMEDILKNIIPIASAKSPAVTRVVEDKTEVVAPREPTKIDTTNATEEKYEVAVGTDKQSPRWLISTLILFGLLIISTNLLVYILSDSPLHLATHPLFDLFSA